MTGSTRYVVDYGWIAPDGLLHLIGARPLEDSTPWPAVRSYITQEAMEEKTLAILADLQLKEGRPAAVAYDKETDRHFLYTADGAVQEVPWDWGKWPPHIKVDVNA